MRKFFYKSIIIISRKLGLWVFVVYAWIVATGFFLLFPLRVGNSVRLYRALYPDRNHLFHLWCAWRQFHNFTDVFMDRFLLQESDAITFTSKGCEHLEKSIDDGKGGILLMSHMGNWDVAAQLEIGKTPLIMENDYDALTVCMMTAGLIPCAEQKIMRIKNTLYLDEVDVSLAYVPELENRSDLKIIKPARVLKLEQDGYFSKFLVQ